jgi:hypothetical protein
MQRKPEACFLRHADKGLRKWENSLIGHSSGMLLSLLHQQRFHISITKGKLLILMLLKTYNLSDLKFYLE